MTVSGTLFSEIYANLLSHPSIIHILFTSSSKVDKLVKSKTDGDVESSIYKAQRFFRDEAIHVVCRVSEKLLQRSKWDFLRRHQRLNMYIKCWGSRGSIPVSGKEYLKYGGDTTCLEIRTKSNDIIIIDAGTGIRRLGNLLTDEKQNKYHFLFTHAHWDHVMGFPYFKPLYSRDAEFRMHRCPFHDEFVESIISKVMAPPNFPVKYSDIRAELSYEEASPVEFEIGNVKVVPIAISHPNGGSGYKLIEDGKSFVFLTDNELGFIHPGGHPYKDYVKFSLGADLLIHDAEYTPEEYKTFIDWGHSVYTDVLNLAFEAGVKKVGLFHLNQERTDREMNKIVKACGKIIAEKGSSLECFAVECNMTFEL